MDYREKVKYFIFGAIIMFILMIAFYVVYGDHVKISYMYERISQMEADRTK